MKFLIKSPFDSMSGYGNDGRGIARSLAAMGHDVHLYPMSVACPIDQVTAALLTKWPDPPYDIEIVHAPPKLLVTEREREAVKRVIGWTMWEWEQLRDFEGTDDETARADFGEHMRDFDLLLNYDEVTATALDPLTVTPTTILQGGYDPSIWAGATTKRDWDADPFRFVMVGRMDKRKNPWLAVRAFAQLKDEHPDFNAELHLKSHHHAIPPGLAGRWPGLVSHAAWWPQLKMREFYMSMHCLLAPSTGEGKNVPALEAMTTGMPVIATDYGGHRQWLRSDYGYPLRWSPKEYSIGWAADPDLEHLKELMWHVYTHRYEAKRKGELAARTIPAMCSWDAVMHRFMARVAEVPEREIQWDQERAALLR
jgi:glycosyltransferase involved in cell wall biosynthesis